MSEKICTKCKEIKDAEKDFYICKGIQRSECKKCTIKKNLSYQRTAKPWVGRTSDKDEQRSYSVQYYAKNREKFALYRASFKERHPSYHKDYGRKRRDEKRGK